MPNRLSILDLPPDARNKLLASMSGGGQANRLMPRVPLGGLEAVPAFGSALLGSVPAGLHGLATLSGTGDLERAAAATQRAQDALTYRPRTEAGQAATARMGAGLNRLAGPSEWIGGQILKHTGSPAAATLGEMVLDPLDLLPGAKALGAVGDLALPVFHGTPHKFDQFKLSPETSMSGEGAQAYGHGLYFAENPGIAESYRKNLTDWRLQVDDAILPGVGEPIKGIEGLSGVELDDLASIRDRAVSGFNAQPSIDDLIDAEEKGVGLYRKALADGGGKFAPELISEAKRKVEIADRRVGLLEKLRGRMSPSAGYFYEVDVPDEAAARMLDWDAPLAEQPDAVREALKKAVATLDNPYIQQGIDKGVPVQSLYQEIGQAVAPRGAGMSEIHQAASQWLRDNGVPGIRYFDAGSRQGGEGTRNMVLFDDSLAKILRRE